MNKKCRHLFFIKKSSLVKTFLNEMILLQCKLNIIYMCVCVSIKLPLNILILMHCSVGI